MKSILTPLILSATFAALLPSQGAAPTEATCYLTARQPQSRLENKGRIAFAPLSQPNEHDPMIMVDTKKTFQTILGFGGAFTDAAALTYSRLSPAQKREFLAACFDPVNGNGYTLCRLTIGSCDYSDVSYSYDTVPGDKELAHFTIEHDQKDRIPFVKEAWKVSSNGLKLFASPWTPPPWMKSNNDYLHGGKLMPEYYQTWADYFSKYIKAYAKEGLPIWGITVQNEAMATQIFESCVFTAEEERDFVKNYLGPTLAKDNLSDVKLMIWDHNRGLMYQRAETVYDDPQASKYVWGTAFHWYTGNHFDNVRLVHDAFPDKHLIYTEGGIGMVSLGGGRRADDWNGAERLAKSVIEDLNNWTEGWAVWNLLVDENGGPNHVARRGASPPANDGGPKELVYQATHYVFGHFSRFIKPGAKRIIAASDDDNLLSTAFLNPDGKVAVVVLNTAPSEMNLRLWIDNKAARTDMPAQSIMTFVFDE